MSVNELSMEILENRTFYVSDPQLKKTRFACANSITRKNSFF